MLHWRQLLQFRLLSHGNWGPFIGPYYTPSIDYQLFTINLFSLWIISFFYPHSIITFFSFCFFFGKKMWDFLLRFGLSIISSTLSSRILQHSIKMLSKFYYNFRWHLIYNKRFQMLMSHTIYQTILTGDWS